MKINLHFLREDCTHLKFEGFVADGPGVAECEYPLLFDALPDKLDPAFIYVIEAKNLPASHPVLRGKVGRSRGRDQQTAARPSLVCCGKPPEKWLNAEVNLIYAPQATSVSALLNSVVQVISKYARWEAQLQEIVDCGMPVAELARCSVDLFGNPIFAQSAAFNILFCELPNCEDPDGRLETYMHDNFVQPTEDSAFVLPDSVLALLSADQEYLEAVDAVGASLYSGAPFEDRTLFYNCRIEGVSVARVAIDEVMRPFLNRDYVLLETLGKYITKAQPRSDTNAFDLPRDYENVLRSMLEHKLVPASRIEALLGVLGWGMRDEYLVFIVSASAIAREHADALLQVSLNLELLQPHMHFIAYANRSVFVCNLSKAGVSRKECIAKLTPAARDYLVKVSFATSSRDFKDLFYYYNQALWVEKAGAHVNPMLWVLRYEDLAVDVMIDRCLEKSIPGALFTSNLKDLIEYDKAKGTQYVRLLKLYLDNDRGVAQTARKAFMHRNTFIYQIERIKEIMHSNFEDPDERAALNIALRAYERRSNQPEGDEPL